jgi:L-ascorbate metabolism protein UlaG (beta-lactamase superfamily)
MAIPAVTFPKHFDGKRFYNPDAPQARGFADVLRWTLTSRAESSPAFVADVTPSTPPAGVEGDRLRVTLVNHSTVLIQMSGLNVLTDPIWSERASPFLWVGPRRHRAPGVRLEELPVIDAVLISHNHYDHLDLPTLRLLTARGARTFVVPRGVAALLRAEGIGSISELDWGDNVVIGGTSVTAVPALHFSARGLSDRNRTLWCGYLIAAHGGPVYFAGDTAFGGHFQSIRDAYGAPRLALLPIGAYEPRWFMSSAHMCPEEAIRAHAILNARTSIAIHHGTFQLADDGIDTAEEKLRSLWPPESSPPESFLILKNGESASLL